MFAGPVNPRYPKREKEVRERYERIAPTLDERGRRLFTANEAVQFGYGGRDAVERATGVAKNTIRKGIEEFLSLDALGPPKGMQRRPGGGRKPVEETDPGLVDALRALVEPATRGDPEGPLLYSSKSTAKLARELAGNGHPVSADTVARVLKDQGFTLQGTRKVLEGDSHPDRDAQFRWISDLANGFIAEGQPVISVDTKKKELVGAYANRGHEWHVQGEGPDVLTYDFPNGVPKAVPYGVYDLARNDGWVSVGTSSDTAEFATATIERWWNNMGMVAYPDAKALMITADCGGSNGYRLRLWLLSLQRLADKIGLAIVVAHFPPGTSKWNKIEHRMFSMITMNWRGRPLTSYETIVQLIGSTTSTKGLTIRCEIDRGTYEKGRQVSDAELDAVHVERDDFHGEWNYTVHPRTESR
jgi:Rhodopirellula transposase DDE domain